MKNIKPDFLGFRFF